jgi:hypothetical protein
MRRSVASRLIGSRRALSIVGRKIGCHSLVFRLPAIRIGRRSSLSLDRVDGVHTFQTPEARRELAIEILVFFHRYLVIAR